MSLTSPLTGLLNQTEGSSKPNTHTLPKGAASPAQLCLIVEVGPGLLTGAQP
ncbi:hypothetical protein [Deinococcus ruber]|uniref:Uncharacterized protein n=1 Tax=Deinococcus ruber TaxID=1848197 RepID=A0A918CD53_9DEIO|nr:hypothetical protein [Deinococcus ruber]GGR16346.1 hypothetical protein GCM10008957_31240 [Deinococcus ruber]